MRSSLALVVAALLVVGCATTDPTPRNVRAASKLSPTTFRFGPSPSWDSPPRFISGSSPVYPLSILLKHKANGYAIVQFTIGTDGRTHGLIALESSQKEFADHAIIAMRDWRFEPAQKDGVPIDASVIQRWDFNKY